MNLTSRLQHCIDAVTITLMIYNKINLLYNVEATLAQGCEFDVVASIM